MYGDTPHLVLALLGQLDGLGEKDGAGPSGVRERSCRRPCGRIGGQRLSYAAMRPRQHKPCHEPYRADDHHRVARARYQQVRRLHGGNQESRSTHFT